MKATITINPADPVDRLALGTRISKENPDCLVLVQCEEYTGEGSWVLAFGPLEMLDLLERLYRAKHRDAANLKVADQPHLSLPGAVLEIQQLLQQNLVPA